MTSAPFPDAAVPAPLFLPRAGFFAGLDAGAPFSSAATVAALARGLGWGRGFASFDLVGAMCSRITQPGSKKVQHFRGTKNPRNTTCARRPTSTCDLVMT